ncbi:MAG TPA: hypothetical protein VN408_24335, partial [Actinoplanes sp.]|nr:hypothetical protein [Actinoplanes sp.]
MAGKKHDVRPSDDRSAAAGDRAGAMWAGVRVLAGACSVIFGLYVGGISVAAFETDGLGALFSVVVIVGGVILLAQA